MGVLVGLSQRSRGTTILCSHLTVTIEVSALAHEQDCHIYCALQLPVALVFMKCHKSGQTVPFFCT